MTSTNESESTVSARNKALNFTWGVSNCREQRKSSEKSLVGFVEQNNPELPKPNQTWDYIISPQIQFKIVKKLDRDRTVLLGSVC